MLIKIFLWRLFFCQYLLNAKILHLIIIMFMFTFITAIFYEMSIVRQSITLTSYYSCLPFIMSLQPKATYSCLPLIMSLQPKTTYSCLPLIMSLQPKTTYSCLPLIMSLQPKATTPLSGQISDILLYHTGLIRGGLLYNTHPFEHHYPTTHQTVESELVQANCQHLK